jgi:hypothetical protein
MADISFNILNHLQQHSMEPPAGAFDKAWRCMAQHEPPEALPEMERVIFSQLQDHSITAPAFSFTAITRQTQKKSTLSIPLYWQRAAGLILVLASASILYFLVFRRTHPAQDNYAAATKKTDSSLLIANTFQIDSTVTTMSNASTQVTTGQGEKSKKTPGLTVTFGNGDAELYENDLLLTLVNYRSNEWGHFFTRAVAERRISLNKYSYHQLSDKMVLMLQDTYLTKRNGKPSWKAKRTKRKFEKWRKKEEKYFDKDLQKNPADIIDLSEFILKN